MNQMFGASNSAIFVYRVSTDVCSFFGVEFSKGLDSTYGKYTFGHALYVAHVPNRQEITHMSSALLQSSLQV